MTKAKRNTTTPNRPISTITSLGQQLDAAWVLHGAADVDLATAAQAGAVIDSLEDLILKLPARSPSDAILQLALITLSLEDAANPGPNYSPPDYSILSQVVGIATWVLADTLKIGGATRDLLKAYARQHGPIGADEQRGIRCVAAAMGV